MTLLNLAINTLLQKIPNIDAIYVFGSFGTSFQNKDSDLDLAFLAPISLSSLERYKIAQEIALIIQKDIDLIDLKEASTVLRFQIISTGKRIYCRDPYQSDLFETTVYSAYVRFNDERHELLEGIKTRGGRILRG